MAEGFSSEYWASIFNRYGLGEVWNEIKGSYTETTLNEEIWERVRNSQGYNKTFPGITERAQKGLSPLTEEEYLRIRDSYRKSLEIYGIDIEDIAVDSEGRSISANEALGKLIAKDVSPVEFSDRLRIAKSWSSNADPNVKEALRTFYGLEDKDLMAYALNPQGGQALLQRRAAGVQIAAQALESGFDIYATRQAPSADGLGAGFLEELATRGLSDQASAGERAQAASIAEEAVARAGEQRATFERLAAIEGVDLTAQEQVESQFTGVTGRIAGAKDAAARGKVAGLRSRERARFGGSGVGTNIFGNNESGSF